MNKIVGFLFYFQTEKKTSTHLDLYSKVTTVLVSTGMLDSKISYKNKKIYEYYEK